jgi:hypothetical protein
MLSTKHCKRPPQKNLLTSAVRPAILHVCSKVSSIAFVLSDFGSSRNLLVASPCPMWLRNPLVNVQGLYYERQRLKLILMDSVWRGLLLWPAQWSSELSCLLDRCHQLHHLPCWTILANPIQSPRHCMRTKTAPTTQMNARMSVQ